MAKMIEEPPPFQETKATVLSCAKGQKTVCMCVCVCIWVGSVEEKTVSMCVCVLGLGVWKSVCMGTWPDKMKHLFLGVTFIKETPLSFSCLKDST